MKNLTRKILDSAKYNEQNYHNLMQKRDKLVEHFGNDKKLSDYLLDSIILDVITASSIGIDLIQTLEDYYKGESIRIWIPIMPPGINATYGVDCRKKGKFYTGKDGKQRKMNPVYKTPEAKQWEKDATVLIRNAANYRGFLINKEKDKLSINILMKGSEHDVDAPIKMIVDTVARTLEFDDKIVMNVESSIKRDTTERGVLIEIEKI